MDSKCHNCGHEWQYRGQKSEGEKAVCPNCTYNTPAGMQAPDRIEREPVEANCDKCGYSWEYRGTQDNNFTCPSCHGNVTV